MDNTPIGNKSFASNIAGIPLPPETPLNDNKRRYKHRQNRITSGVKSNSANRHYAIYSSGMKLGNKFFSHGKSSGFKKLPVLANATNSSAHSPTTLQTPFKATKYMFSHEPPKMEHYGNTEFLDYMREWRDSAMTHKHYVTVDFVNEKICSYLLEQEGAVFIRNNLESLEEFYQLLNCKFLMKEYSKVIDLFQNNEVVGPIVSHFLPCVLLVGLSFYELGKFEESLSFLGDGEDDSDELERDTTESKFNLFSPPDKENTNCAGKLVLGDVKISLNESRIESSICCLRGKLQLKLNQFQHAKIQLQKAVLLNLQNYESFQILVENSMMTKQELLSFYNALPFNTQIDNDHIRDLVKSLYYKHLSYGCSADGDSEPLQHVSKVEDNEDEAIGSFYDNDDAVKDHGVVTTMDGGNADMHIRTFGLVNNRESKISAIRSLYGQCKYLECVKKCEAFMVGGLDSYNDTVLVHYISSLFEINNKVKLLDIVNELIMKFPRSWITEFASGTQQLCIKKLGSARKHFAKATVLNPHSLASWIGYGHTFVAEYEYEQALVVYATANKLFPGSHIPLLFMGMQYIAMEDFIQSEQYLKIALEIDKSDPLLLNELGVIYYQQNDFLKAKKYLKKAYEVITAVASSDHPKQVVPYSNNKTWNGIFINLGHTYRKLNDLSKALMCFEMINDTSMQNANILTSMGLICLKLLKLERCIDYLHRALSISPENSMAQSLLSKAMELNCGE